MLHNPVLLQLIKQFQDKLLPIIIDGICQNISNESKLTRDMFVFGNEEIKKSKLADSAESRFKVVASNLECNFAF
jgi:hypothetical protein